VILSDAFWRTQFGGDPRIVGSLIRLNEREYSVIGVLPATFTILPASSVLPERVDVWLPLQLHLPSRDRSVRFLHALARLRPGVSFGQADQDIQAYGMRVTGQYATGYGGGAWRFTIRSFKDDVLKNARMSLSLVFGLVLLVLLMACSNVANLLLARGEGRRAELAIRTALGAGPARLAGELIAEALVLAAAGSALGLGLAVVVPHALRAFDPAALPRLDEAGVDLRVAVFTGGLIFLSAAIFVFAPLVERVRFRGVSAAMTNRGGGRTRRSARLGSALVVVQTALATTVLITTCFLTVTFVRLHSTDLGFGTDSLLTGRITLSPEYAGSNDVARFFESATTAIEQIGGVIDAAAITQVPLSGAMLGSTFLVGPGPDAHRIDADLRGITPDYFDVARTPMVRGRRFTDRDAPNTPPVAIVDESFARRLRPDGEVVGQRIRWFRQPEAQIEIVGVVRSVRHRGPGDPPRETVYRPHRQYPRNSMFLVVRTSVDAATIASTLRAAVSSVDPTQPIADVATMSQRLDRSVARARTSLMLAGTLGALALGLGVIGLYGVLSFGVAQRLREFGVRMSLGASPSAVRKLVLKEGLTLTLTGVAVGVLAAAVVATLIGNMLYGTSFTDVRQYILGATLVLLSSMAGFWVPARRASAADPLVALRAE
jgi:putative ABC transport system permease protein